MRCQAHHAKGTKYSRSAFLSNTQSILLTSNLTPLCGTLVNFFDSYNWILYDYFLLTSRWIVLVFFSSKLQFQGCCFHTNYVANITLAEQKTTLLKSSE